MIKVTSPVNLESLPNRAHTATHSAQIGHVVLLNASMAAKHFSAWKKLIAWIGTMAYFQETYTGQALWISWQTILWFAEIFCLGSKPPLAKKYVFNSWPSGHKHFQVHLTKHSTRPTFWQQLYTTVSRNTFKLAENSTVK